MSDVTDRGGAASNEIEERPPFTPAELSPDVEYEPDWDEAQLDPQMLEAAKRVFERRRSLLRRLA